MATETNGLYRLVKRQLQEYDKEILQNAAILMDACTLECFGDVFLDCYSELSWATIACLFGCAVASLACGPFFAICLSACFPACGALDAELAGVCIRWALSECCLYS